MAKNQQGLQILLHENDYKEIEKSIEKTLLFALKNITYTNK